jgi:hypothetical protein
VDPTGSDIVHKKNGIVERLRRPKSFTVVAGEARS